MFSQACAKNSVHGGGGEGGSMHGRGCVVGGACMAGGMCGGGHAWQEGVCSCYWPQRSWAKVMFLQVCV